MNSQLDMIEDLYLTCKCLAEKVDELNKKVDQLNSRIDRVDCRTRFLEKITNELLEKK